MNSTRLAACATLTLFGCMLASCSIGGVEPDNAGALDAIANGRSGSEVTVEGPVVRVLATHGGTQGVHERFVVAVRAGKVEQDLLVADNISIGRGAPVRPGDKVTVKGELALDPSGPVIHWTHHDPRGHHESGFVRDNGVLYD
jgi:Protein of unknown function (DUF3465)